VSLAFFLLANRHQTSYEDVLRHTVSRAAGLGVNVVPAKVYAEFETAIHNAVTNVWPGFVVNACRFHLGESWWRKIQSFGLSKQRGKKDSEVSYFLKKIFVLPLLPPSEVSDCLHRTYTQSSDREASGTLLRLPSRNYIDADSCFPPTVWSECFASSMRNMNACESYHAHCNDLFCSAQCSCICTAKTQNETYIKMRNVTKRRLKISATVKKEDFNFSKIGQYRANLISRKEFVSTVSYKFLPNTHTCSSLLLAFTMPLAISVTVHVTVQCYVRQTVS